ncbi:glycosyltransferase family 9 protein, partial [Cellulosimicrobium funkei]|uniref:glycosyltransferase family 9 protein n=1 Tax=Cellulosimicrobium funkei TaxID=264251 RepID=UPI0037574E87
FIQRLVGSYLFIRDTRWPADRFAGVARHLAAAGHDVVVTGGPDERDLCARVVADADAALGGPAGAPDGTGSVTDTAGTLDLPALADVVATARLVVCGDTGVAHLATAYGTPSVVLFGPTPPATWGPAVDPERHAVLWHGDTEQRPAHAPDDAARGYRGDPHAADLDPALGRITVAEVVAAARSLLAGPQDPAEMRAGDEALSVEA